MHKKNIQTLPKQTYLPKKFVYFDTNQIQLQIADSRINLKFGKQIVESYAKYMFKELILYNLSNFKVTKNNSIVDAEIVITDTEVVDFATNTRKCIYINIGQFLSLSKVITSYNISLAQFYMLLAELLSNVLSIDKGFFLHASAVLVHDEAIIFVAPSGTGKSTLMKYLQPNYPAVADDSVIIREYAGQYYLYQTPFIEKESWIIKTQKRIRIKKIVFINQYSSIRSESLTKIAVKELMSDQIPSNLGLNKKTIQYIEYFINNAPEDIFEALYFPKNKRVVVDYFHKKYE